jgi:hypothetical protein
MPKHTRNLPPDPIEAAHSIVAQLTGEEPRTIPDDNAGAEALTLQRRKLSALKAAYARWSKKVAT